MNFWGAFVAYLVGCVAVFFALSINGKTEQPGGAHGHGHDDHGHGGGHH